MGQEADVLAVQGQVKAGDYSWFISKRILDNFQAAKKADPHCNSEGGHRYQIQYGCCDNADNTITSGGPKPTALMAECCDAACGFHDHSFEQSCQAKCDSLAEVSGVSDV